MSITGKIRRRLRGLGDQASDLLSDRLERRAWKRATEAPLADRPLGTAEQYLELWHRAQADSNPEVDAYERRTGAAIDQAWFQQLALVTQVAIKKSPPCYFHGRLLYSTLVRYASHHAGEALTIVETGTARGFSTLCLSRALADSRASGRVFTFDILPHETRIFWNSIGDTNGPRTRAELLRDYSDLLERFVVFHRGDTRVELRKVTFPRVHFAFLDSVHTYDHVMAEYAALRGRQQRGDVLFFDDYTRDAYPGVVRAADEICRSEGYAATVIAGGPHRAYLIAEKQ